MSTMKRMSEKNAVTKIEKRGKTPRKKNMRSNKAVPLEPEILSFFGKVNYYPDYDHKKERAR